MKLTIYRRLFYAADCYQAAYKQKSVGVQVHSTGANNPWLHRWVQPDDGRIGVNKYDNSHNRPGITTCASAYIGKQTDGTVAVYQTLPWDYRCWLSGGGTKGRANNIGYVGFEILEDNRENEAYFNEAVMVQAAALTAHLCTLFGCGTDMVKDHRELHDMGIASNHGDILHWLKLYKLTMNDFRAKVEQYMREGVDVTYIDCDDIAPLYYARYTGTGKYLNLRAQPDKGAKSIKQITVMDTVEVLDDRDKQWWYCRVDGVTGYAMKEYLVRVEEAQQEQQEAESEKDDEDIEAPEKTDEDEVIITMTRQAAVKLMIALSTDPAALDAETKELTLNALIRAL